MVSANGKRIPSLFSRLNAIPSRRPILKEKQPSWRARFFARVHAREPSVRKIPPVTPRETNLEVVNLRPFSGANLTKLYNSVRSDGY